MEFEPSMTAMEDARPDPWTNRQARMKQWAEVPRLLASGRLIKEDQGWYRLRDSGVMNEIRKIVWKIRHDDVGTPTHVTLW
jgi:hypothetical protein